MSLRAACRLETLGFRTVYDYTGGKADWLAPGLSSEGPGASTPRPGSLARTDVPTCGFTETVRVARASVRSSGEECCVVISETGIVLGVLDAEALVDDGRCTALGASDLSGHHLGDAALRCHQGLTSRHRSWILPRDPAFATKAVLVWTSTLASSPGNPT
ncbi:MAG: hypothetical protein ACYC1D_08470, partial [Acidimicrobiales bacterium]